MTKSRKWTEKDDTRLVELRAAGRPSWSQKSLSERNEQWSAELAFLKKT
jgi:hypothetical protein